MSTFTKSPVSVGHGAAARGGVLANRRVVPIVVGVAIIGVGYAAFSWLDVASWFRRDAAETSVHIVQSATLSIVISEDGELKPKDQIEIKNEVEGQSTILSIVAESTRVKKGDLLVELASDQLTERLETEKIELRRVEADAGAAAEELEITRNQNASDLKKAALELEVAELELNKYTHGDYPKEVKTLEIEVERAELDQLRKRDELTKQEKLLVKGFVTQSKLEELRFELKNADRTLEKNKLALDTLNQYERTKNMKQKTSDAERAREELQRVQKRGASKEKQAEVRLEQAQSTLQVRRTRLDRLIEQVGKCKTIAPVDGVVQYPTSRWGWDEFRPAQGQKVQEGQTLCVLPDTSQMIVSFRIHEGDRHRVKDGMPCVVRVTAVPGKTFTGKISKIARFADSANRWINPDLKEHAAEILLDGTDAPLAPGDSAEIKIMIEEVPNALAVPVQAVHARGKKNFVFVQRLTGAEPVEVKLGKSTSTMVEITSGLSAGDRALLRTDERLEALLPAINTANEKDADPAKPRATAEAGQTGDAKAVDEAIATGEGADTDADTTSQPAQPAADTEPAEDSDAVNADEPADM